MHSRNHIYRIQKHPPGEPVEVGSVSEVHRHRARKLLATEIAFVPHPDFGRVKLPELSVEPPPAAPASRRVWLKELPPHVARLGEAALLTPDRERELFRRMNYVKYRANAVRATLDPENPQLSTLDQAERWLHEARQIRDQIVRANMRLAMAVAKKFVTPRHSFDELLSDGLLTLLKTVEKFDYSRGFRYSTYAYRALSRSSYRAVQDRIRREAAVGSWSEGGLAESAARESSLPDEATWRALRGDTQRLLSRLSPRECFILRGRFGLEGEGEERTFQSLATELGLSKERVRQIEHRALARLREIAEETGIRDTWDDSLP